MSLKFIPIIFYSVAIGAKKAELRSTEDRTFYAGDYVFPPGVRERDLHWKFFMGSNYRRR